MAATKSASSIIARGTSCAAFTQLTGCSVTRSGTTATLTRTTHGRSNGDKVLIQGFAIEEFNGLFTVANATTNTFDYTIKQDPGANPSGTTGTVDLATLGTAVDMSSAYGGEVYGGIQNGNTGPGVKPEIWVGISSTTNEYDYLWRPFFAGDVTANSWNTFQQPIPLGRMYLNFCVVRNTSQAVDAFVLATKVTAV